MEWTITISRLMPVNSIYCKETYVHHFTVTCQDFRKTQEVYKELREHYPAPKYEINVTEWERLGTEITVDELEMP